MADNQEYATTLGPDAVFKGELTFEKGLRLQGRVEGKIHTAGRLHIAKEAKLQADVEAGAIVVEGDVRGNLSANDRIELKQSARYEGDLHATKLVVDEGAVFSGHVQVGPEAVKGGAVGPSGGNSRGISGGGSNPGANAGAPSRPIPVPQGQGVK
jgi:cytoskeletal protein CcmA (bactofilin family)